MLALSVLGQPDCQAGMTGFGHPHNHSSFLTGILAIVKAVECSAELEILVHLTDE